MIADGWSNSVLQSNVYLPRSTRHQMMSARYGLGVSLLILCVDDLSGQSRKSEIVIDSTSTLHALFVVSEIVFH